MRSEDSLWRVFHASRKRGFARLGAPRDAAIAFGTGREAIAQQRSLAMPAPTIIARACVILLILRLDQDAALQIAPQLALITFFFETFMCKEEKAYENILSAVRDGWFQNYYCYEICFSLVSLSSASLSSDP